MTTNTTIEVVGLKDSLRVLQQYNKSLRRQITKDFNYIVNDAVQQIRIEVPDEAPISGWERNWTTRSGYKMLPWRGNLANTAIKPYVSGKKPKEFAGVTRNLAVFGVRWKAPHATLFDMSRRAKTPQGRNMIAGLDSKFGQASRIMWPTFNKYEDEITDKMRDLVKKVTRAANDEIRRARGK
jgi:hypothetical protein